MNIIAIHIVIKEIITENIQWFGFAVFSGDNIMYTVSQLK